MSISELPETQRMSANRQPLPVEPEPEREPLSDDERRKIVARGSVVLGPGRG